MNSFKLRHISKNFVNEFPIIFRMKINFFFDVFYLIILKSNQVFNEYTEGTARFWILLDKLFTIQENLISNAHH